MAVASFTTPPLALPGPRGHWLTGSLHDMATDRLAFFDRCFREYGDAAGFRLANRRAVLLSHPDDIERVLVTESRQFEKNYALRLLRPLLGQGLLLAEGDHWLRQRRLIQPVFSRSQVEGYAPAMVELTQQMLAGWKPGAPCNLHQEMTRLTMSIAGKTLLGVDVSGRFGEVATCLETVLRDFLVRFSRALPLPMWVPTLGNLRLKRAIGKLDQVLARLIEQRRGDSGSRGDFLSVLIRARDEEDGRGLSDQQLRDEVMTMFLAGHETTAAALTWTWFLLGQNLEVQARVQAEVQQVLGNRPPAAADIPQLKLCENVLREAMRLYPPAYVVGRRALNNCVIGNHFIAKGTNVLMSQWVVHRDPRWYERPDEFLPDRWSSGLTSRLPKYAYFPFGGGPRVCIGNGFAMLEGVLVLATMAQKTGLLPITQPPIKLTPAITLRPAQPLWMQPSPRV